MGVTRGDLLGVLTMAHIIPITLRLPEWLPGRPVARIQRFIRLKRLPDSGPQLGVIYPHCTIVVSILFSIVPICPQYTIRSTFHAI